MKNTKAIWTIVIVLSLASSPVLAVIEFNDGQIHNIDYQINEDVWVDYQRWWVQTTVNLIDAGRIKYPYSLDAYGNSRVNILGGFIEYKLQAYGNSQVGISGGSIRGFMWTDGNSQVEISGGSISWLCATNRSKVNISAGSIEDVLLATGGSKVNISGGSIGLKVHATNLGHVNISGGSIQDLFADAFSKINVSGSSIGGTLASNWSAILIIYGSDFAVDGEPFGYGELTSILGGFYRDEPIRRLSGTLVSGEPIDNDFYVGYDAKIVLVPEPATLLLLGLGGLIIRKKLKFKM